MKTNKSLYAQTHRAFWEAVASKYLENVEHGTVKGLEDQIPKIWRGYQEYDQWLLKTMIHKKQIIDQIKRIYKRNKSEIITELGDDDPSYVNDFSADYYFENGIGI